MKSQFLLVAILFSLFLTSCGGNPAWTREGDSDDPAIQLAEEACQCIYDVLDDEEGISASQVVEEANDWAMTLQGKQVDPEKIEETMKLLDMEKTLTEKVDESECMEPVEEALFEKGIPFEKLMEMIDQNCTLGLFYN